MYHRKMLTYFKRTPGLRVLVDNYHGSTMQFMVMAILAANRTASALTCLAVFLAIVFRVITVILILCYYGDAAKHKN